MIYLRDLFRMTVCKPVSIGKPDVVTREPTSLVLVVRPIAHGRCGELL
jgi:hypothetical protein